MTIREALNQSKAKYADIFTMNGKGDLINLFYISKRVDSIFDNINCLNYISHTKNTDILLVLVEFKEVIELLILFNC